MWSCCCCEWHFTNLHPKEWPTFTTILFGHMCGGSLSLSFSSFPAAALRSCDLRPEMVWMQCITLLFTCFYLAFILARKLSMKPTIETFFVFRMTRAHWDMDAFSNENGRKRKRITASHRKRDKRIWFWFWFLFDLVVCTLATHFKYIQNRHRWIGISFCQMAILFNSNQQSAPMITFI